MFSFASRLWPSATAKMNIDNEIRADITPLNTYKDPINWKPRPAWPHRLDFVFIHDAVPDHESAWREPVGLKLWPNDLIDDFPSARVIIYQYERSWVKSIGDLVSPDHLRNQTQELLTFLEDERYRSSVPLVVFAHGFGGLLYEQAVVWSRASLDSKQVPISNVLRERKHTAFLFNTPHFGAGIAEWAMITAKSYGIRCAKTAQKQDWSPVKDEIADIATMQFEFRKILKSHGSAASLTGCFSTVQEPVSKLTLAGEWAVLPEFTPVAIKESHSTLTRCRKADFTWHAIIHHLRSVDRQLSKTRPTLPIGIAETPTEGDAAEDLVGEDTTESLADRISNSLLESAVGAPKRKFLPDGFLQKLLTIENIRVDLERISSQLEGWKAAEIEKLVMFIAHKARRLFATLLYCRIADAHILRGVRSGMQGGFDDEKLPLRNFTYVARSKWPDIFQAWDPATLMRFYEAQWAFLSPSFSPQRFSSERFDETTILPLVSADSRAKVDAFYRVYEPKIDSSDQAQGGDDTSNHYEHVVLERVYEDDPSDRRERMRIESSKLPINIVKRMVGFTVQERGKTGDVAEMFDLTKPEIVHYIMYGASMDDYKLLPQPEFHRAEELLLLK